MSSNLQVAHAYAHATNPNNRQLLASNNLSFCGTALTSYRLQIGHRVNDTFVISAYASHTPTTTRHVSIALAAISPQPLIEVFDLAPVDNLQATKRTLESLLSKAATARSKASDYLAQALTYLESHNALCKLLDQPEYALPVDILNVDLPALKQQRKEALARELVAKKAREARYAAQHADRRQKWRDGGPTSGIPGACMLRLKGSVVQTSQGANIPAEDAVKLWPLVLLFKKTKSERRPSVKLGVYDLARINVDGSIVVGCHHIPFAELEMMAGQLGLLKE
jgi:hypothetical protein